LRWEGLLYFVYLFLPKGLVYVTGV